MASGGGSDSGEGEGACSNDELEFMDVDLEAVTGGGGAGRISGDDRDDNEKNEVKGGSDNRKYDPNANVGAEGVGIDVEKKPEVTVTSDPIADLENYARGYSGGLPKIHRLNYIADHCPLLRNEALKLAILSLRDTVNVTLFKSFCQKLQATVSSQAIPGAGGAAPADLPQIDQKWIDESSRVASARLSQLMTDLNSAVTDSAKQEICHKMGEHYLEIGDHISAMRNFYKARDYNSKRREPAAHDDLTKIWLSILRTEMYSGNWKNIFNYLGKLSPAFADNTFTPLPAVANPTAASDNADSVRKPKLNPSLDTLLYCAAGIAELCHKKYKAAVKYFLQANADHFEQNEFITASNVAVYTSICALAAFGRGELHTNVISNNTFKLFLENEPEICEILAAFENSKYSICFALLDRMKDRLTLDIYLGPHIPQLYSLIRQRGLVQYCLPFASADLNKMATSFNTTVLELETELVELILRGHINGRIDSQRKIFYSSQENERNVTFTKALKMGAEYEKNTKLAMLRIQLLRNDIFIKKPGDGDDTGTDGKGGKGKGRPKGGGGPGGQKKGRSRTRASSAANADEPENEDMDE